MSHADAARAMTAATAALVGFGVCLAMFIPLMLGTTAVSLPKALLFSAAMAACFLAHLAFIGIAAKRLDRRPWVWVMLAAFAFPVTAIVGLIVLGFLDAERSETAAGA